MVDSVREMTDREAHHETRACVGIVGEAVDKVEFAMNELKSSRDW